MFEKSVTVMGGCGHVGLPLAIGLAEAGFDTRIFDINEQAVATVRSGVMPFQEEQADLVLPQVIANGKLTVSDDPATLSQSQFVVCVVGTPVDEFLNPVVHRFFDAVDRIQPYLRNGQVLILRSTLFPETSRRLHDRFVERGVGVDVAVCPERVAQGKGFIEAKTLPQIVAGFTERGVAGARFLFSQFGVPIVETSPLEAELAKLFQNVWRYVTFAVANQFYTIANDYGIDFERVHHALTHQYPRGQGIPKPGFAAGPCLFKDTMQLAAFSNNQFFLGHSAMLVNEGLPLYVVQRLAEQHDLDHMTVAILGMAFKANCDDVRDSLAFKLRKILATRCRRVVCADPNIAYAELCRYSKSVPPEDYVATDAAIAAADLIVVGVPHREFKTLDFGGKPVVDIWNMLGRGTRV